MTATISTHDLFRPTRTRSETKAESTDRSARAIIEAEAKRRESKTEKLRQARLEREALEVVPLAPARKRKAKGPKRTGSPSIECRSTEEAVT